MPNVDTPAQQHGCWQGRGGTMPGLALVGARTAKLAAPAIAVGRWVLRDWWGRAAGGRPFATWCALTAQARVDSARHRCAQVDSADSSPPNSLVQLSWAAKRGQHWCSAAPTRCRTAAPMSRSQLLAQRMMGGAITQMGHGNLISSWTSPARLSFDQF